MSIRKEPSGRFRAVVKHRGQYVAGRTFDTKREAEAWERRQLAVLAGGIDLRAGRSLVSDLLPEWVEHRRVSVAKKTYTTDASQAQWVPASLLRVPVSSVTPGMVSDALTAAARDGRARSSLIRYRAVLSGFFAWCVAHGYIPTNPAAGVRVPSTARPPEEMRPYTRDELSSRLAVWRSFDPAAAAVVAFLAATGLRWSEARALTVADVQTVPYPAVIVSRADPEGVGRKATKNGKVRRVPVPDDVLPWLLGRMTSRPSDYILPERWASNLKRRLRWSSSSQGRRIHDLRHTALTLWLADGVSVNTVREWAGHRDLTTTSRYVHWLGSDADRAALDKINRARARHGHTDTEGREAL